MKAMAPDCLYVALPISLHHIYKVCVPVALFLLTWKRTEASGLGGLS